MKRGAKHKMKKRARIATGLVNILRDDVENIRSDANVFDLISLEESIRDAKTTLQMLNDHIMEIEYLLYLINSKETC